MGIVPASIKDILPGISGNVQVYFDPEDRNIARGAVEGTIFRRVILECMLDQIVCTP